MNGKRCIEFSKEGEPARWILNTKTDVMFIDSTQLAHETVLLSMTEAANIMHLDDGRMFIPLESVLEILPDQEICDGLRGMDKRLREQAIEMGKAA